MSGTIGDVFFYQACEEARRLGADKLYISAHSSKESQAAYKALGCVHARRLTQNWQRKNPVMYSLNMSLTKAAFYEKNNYALLEFLNEALREYINCIREWIKK